ncbi:MAG: hypothetical protein JNN23_06995 [Chryseobacterium gambrini]|nr:hypothetical protein [Chryseobacterium gambrini]
MEWDKLYCIVVSTKNYNVEKLEEIKKNSSYISWNNPDNFISNLEIEIFKSFMGEDFGKKELFLEVGSYGNIVEAYENALRKLLEKERKVPKERYGDLQEYLKEYKTSLDPIEDWDSKYDEIHEILGEYYLLAMRYPKDRLAYEFNKLHYLRIKSFYDSRLPLYISTPISVKNLGF